ncbi:hypothetical protein BD779DRAFT_1678445 [Infundibulicybe gibba]|nr:hypothetical protein BD779DRAFT_1678445 [Infundibulicybe gibba]
MLSNEIAALVGFGCEATLYGVYCVLFVMSMAILVWRRRTRELNTAMVVANVALFVCCTIHYALEFNHFYNRLRSNGLTDFADETHVLFAADIFLSLADFLGDMVLIYRCWLVWGKNYYIIILPFLTALSGFICAMEVLHLLLGIDPSAPVPPPVLVPLGIAGYTLPLCTNAIITALIVGRIYYTSRGLKTDEVQPGYNSGHGAAERAMSIIIESGGLYLVTQFIFVVLYGIKHPAVAIVAVAAVQIYGIAPTLIIIRVGWAYLLTKRRTLLKHTSNGDVLVPLPLPKRVALAHPQRGLRERAVRSLVTE